MPANSDEIIFVDGEKVWPLPARPFSAGLFGKTLEDALQTLIEKYPKLILGSQIEPGNEDPPRFALLCREMVNTSGSLDHLLVDQRGVLTLLEAKLIQNPESRRAVVGQISEYAACAKEAWGNGKVRVKATAYWQKKGDSVGSILREVFQADFDEEKFWGEVEDNLEEGKIRLIIATDELRPEVRRIIEYLNLEMKRARVYGLEIRCYGNESGSLVLVPTLVGQTQTVREPSDAKAWSVDELRRAYNEFSDRRMGQALRQVLDWAAEKGFFLATAPVVGVPHMRRVLLLEWCLRSVDGVLLAWK
jgi:hypothetical protein